MRLSFHSCNHGAWFVALCALSVVCASSAADDAHLKDHVLRDTTSNHEQLAERYQSEFPGLDRSIIGRQNDDAKALSNNAPAQSNIEAGDTQYWTFPKSALQRSKSPKPTGVPSKFEDCPTAPGAQSPLKNELRKRQGDPSFYVTLNVCDQPTPKGQSLGKAPDQLKFYISTDATNTKPSEGKNDHIVTINQGYGSFNMTANKDVFIAVSAPANTDYTGIYNYELTASIDDHYAKSNSSSASKYIDSDKQSVLIYTSNTTSCNSSEDAFQAWRQNAPPFQVFVINKDDPSTNGLQNSMCGLKKHAQIRSADTMKTGITLAGGGQPKQQFYISGLNASSSYYAIIALEGTDGNSSSIGGGKVNGGGTIWGTTNFTTKSSPNCAVIYDLDFCSEVAYAVPSSSTDADKMADLRATYDSYASNAYQNFSKSLMQIPCNTTDSAQYSLAVSCDDCAAAYKNWLCAVTVPRCEDFSNNASYLLPRSTGYDFIDADYGRQFANDPTFSAENKSISYLNSSRNVLIDSVIKPGPYKELLPCEDLCYGLVRSCPAVLQFSCPLVGHGLNHSYAKLQPVGQDVWSCNFPGTDLNGSISMRVSLVLMYSVAIMSSIWLLFT